MWLLQCCLAALVLASRAAYYHEHSMTTLQPPEPLPKDSFFGYSIAYHSNSLVVSAPRADLNGQVFSCSLDTNKCSRMEIMTKELPRVDEDGMTHNHNFWLGATVKAFKDDLLVCAPRSTSNMLLYDQKHFGTRGLCYAKKPDENHFISLPQIKKSDRDPKFGKMERENTTDSFGWSIDVDETTSKVRVGSPALAVGRVMAYTDTSGAVGPEIFRRSENNENGFNFGYSIANGNFLKNSQHGVAVSTPYGDNGIGMVLFYTDEHSFQYKVSDPMDKVGSLFGAALCAANVNKQTVLLVGAPAYFNDKNYHTGIVYVYNHETVATKIKGPNKYGAFFGYAIANAGDLDQDKKDEIAIAAPYEDYGRGAVYLYSGSSLEKEGRDLKWLQRFQPKDPFWNLGLSLTTDKHSRNGCNGKSGTTGRWASAAGRAGLSPVNMVGFNMKHIKEDLIYVREIDTRTFFALVTMKIRTKKKNHVEVFCTDLALGAPGNDSVAIYHCLTVIAVKVTAEFPNLQKRTDKTKFKFNVCLNGRYPSKPKDIQANFTVKVKITHPNATLTHAEPSQDYEEYSVTLDNNRKRKQKSCREIHVTTAENGDFEHEIQFGISAKLLDDPAFSTKFDPSRATLSANSVLTVNRAVSAADCKKTTCEPRLTVALTTSMKPVYVVGSSETETVTVVVHNGEGDTAYRPCVRVTVSGDGGATIHRAPPQCIVKNQAAVCQLQTLLRPNSSWDVSKTSKIELGLTSLTSKNRIVNISAEVFNRCIMEKGDKVETITRNLTTDSSNVRIDNKTDQGEEVPFNSKDIASGRTIHHTYTISNTAGTNWVDLHSYIRLYKQPYIEFNAPIEVYSGDTSRTQCQLPKTVDSSTGYHSVSCPIGDLKAKQTIVVVIPITVLPGALEEVFKTSNGTAETALVVQFELDEHGKSEITNLIPGERKVPLWIIIAAAGVGFLLLLLIGFALYECGFLRRENKAKLENLQKEVKRKSMMLQRQSMRLSDSARAELRNRTFRELLDSAELQEAEEGVEAREDNRKPNTNGKEAEVTEKVGKNPMTSGLNGNQSVSNQDLKARIEKSLQKPRSKGPRTKSDEKMLCDGNEI